MEKRRSFTVSLVNIRRVISIGHRRISVANVPQVIVPSRRRPSHTLELIGTQTVYRSHERSVTSLGAWAESLFTPNYNNKTFP
ncbi:hypothetical protein J6590_048652 [Homalodisca vitripennis]|nr:hypothetical protein J6590_048652 [Homalodisca vitripennis]